MRGLIILLACFFFFYAYSPGFASFVKNFDVEATLQSIKSKLQEYTSGDVTDFQTKLSDLKDDFQTKIEKQPLPIVEKPNLTPPTQQTFSVHNIELGDKKTDIEQQYGQALRTTMNEYGTIWHTYHKSYQNFYMVAYDKAGNVAALYTNQGLISSSIGIKRGSSKQELRQKLGQPMTKIQKGLVYYQLQEDRDYDLFLMDGSYVTIFYDKHENNIVSAIQIIRQDLEDQKANMYANASPQLKEGFEYQKFDLTNASRALNGLPVLTWDERVRVTAREHSDDMARNNYFNHINPEGKSPFDRMEEDEIRFSYAGENLAYGQFSAIFAHEGLMNSLGHRKNILKKEFELLGVGVSFNAEMQPYFTENYYTK